MLDGGDIRQQMAVLLIERHYYNYMHVRPGQFCDAYGSLRFVGDRKARVAKHAVVPDDVVDMRVTRLIVKHWKARPSALISVTGGAKDFVLRPRLSEVFSRGLLGGARDVGDGAHRRHRERRDGARGLGARRRRRPAAARLPPPGRAGRRPSRARRRPAQRRRGAGVPYVVPDGRVGLEPVHSTFSSSPSPAPPAARGATRLRSATASRSPSRRCSTCRASSSSSRAASARCAPSRRRSPTCAARRPPRRPGRRRRRLAARRPLDAHRSDPWSTAARRRRRRRSPTCSATCGGRSPTPRRRRASGPEHLRRPQGREPRHLLRAARLHRRD